jgi:Mg2+-importing ATPase
MMSVAVETPDKNYRLLTKGAPESVFPRCGFFELGGRDTPDGADHNRRSQELSMDVFRVLAVAYKSLQARPTYSKEEESELILKGYVAFLDPPKETAEKAIAALKKNRGRRHREGIGHGHTVRKKLIGAQRGRHRGSQGLREYP